MATSNPAELERVRHCSGCGAPQPGPADEADEYSGCCVKRVCAGHGDGPRTEEPCCSVVEALREAWSTSGGTDADAYDGNDAQSETTTVGTDGVDPMKEENVQAVITAPAKQGGPKGKKKDKKKGAVSAEVVAAPKAAKPKAQPPVQPEAAPPVAPSSGRKWREALGPSVVDGWEKLYEYPKQGCEMARKWLAKGKPTFALVCVEHGFARPVSRQAEADGLRTSGRRDWCDGCKAKAGETTGKPVEKPVEEPADKPVDETASEVGSDAPAKAKKKSGKDGKKKDKKKGKKAEPLG